MTALSRTVRRSAALLAAVALATSCAGGPARTATPPTPTPTPTPTPRAPAAPKPAPAAVPSVSPVAETGTAVTIVLGGDVDFDRTTRAAIARGGVDAPWEGIAPRLRGADLAVLNLECAVSTRGTPQPKTYRFRGDPAALAGAVNAGVDAFSLANNHTLDYGPLAFADTLRHVRDAGIQPFGAGPDLAAALAPAVFDVRGTTVAFVGFSGIIPAPSWEAGENRAGIATDDDASIRAAVTAAKRRADVVVAFFHWGVEYTYAPSARQRRAARTAIAAGATLVAGTHPHVLQPVEVVDGRLVAWSLSNLVFQSRPASVRTELLTVRIQPDGAVDWRTDPYLITRGVPRPDAARTPKTGRVPAPR